MKEPVQPLQPCLSCGGRPRASIEVGAGSTVGAIECCRCGVRTTPGLSYEEAWQEWNALVRRHTPTARGQ